MAALFFYPPEAGGRIKYASEPTFTMSDTANTATSRNGLIERLRAKLNRGDSWLTRDISELFSTGSLDEATVEELEACLLMADVGVEATTGIIEGLKKPGAGAQSKEAGATGVLRSALLEILVPCDSDLAITDGIRPFVILVVGVNGSGKTTTIGKLAKRLKSENGLKVMLAAGDTFRAAAVEQLQAWGARNDVPVIAQQSGADSAAVIYDALTAAQSKGVDVVIADTAGRLHTQSNLMEELKKIRRVIEKAIPSAPHEVLLVLDAATGQNALQQARQFDEAVGVTGLAITKMDSTAKGGILLAIARNMEIPIRFIGIGEQAEDLLPFNAEAYVDAILQT